MFVCLTVIVHLEVCFRNMFFFSPLDIWNKVLFLHYLYLCVFTLAHRYKKSIYMVFPVQQGKYQTFVLNYF